MPIIKSDQDLIKSYLSGNESAFEILITKHKDKVFAFILSKIKNYNLAHDVFQDTFIKVINSLKKGKYNVNVRQFRGEFPLTYVNLSAQCNVNVL